MIEITNDDYNMTQNKYENKLNTEKNREWKNPTTTTINIKEGKIFQQFKCAKLSMINETIKKILIFCLM